MQYSYPVVQTEILEDEEMMTALEELCTDPRSAKDPDILGVELPYAGIDVETNWRVLVAHADRGSLLIPWYALLDGGRITAKQVKCIAKVFMRRAYHYSFPILDHITDGMGNPGKSALIVANGYGALIRRFEDDDDEDFLDQNAITDDASMQVRVNQFGAIALPRSTSNHMSAKNIANLEMGQKLISRAQSIFDPRSNEFIYPGAKMPAAS